MKLEHPRVLPSFSLLLHTNGWVLGVMNGVERWVYDWDRCMGRLGWFLVRKFGEWWRIGAAERVVMFLAWMGLNGQILGYLNDVEWMEDVWKCLGLMGGAARVVLWQKFGWMVKEWGCWRWRMVSGVKDYFLDEWLFLWLHKHVYLKGLGN